MITFVIPQQAQVISVNGKAEHILEQDSQSLESGYEIAAGGKIEVTSGAQVILKYADGSQVIIDEHFKANDDADTPDVAMDVLDEITASSDKPVQDQPQVSDDILAEIRAIQDLILSDEEFIDPVSTAAGSASDGGRSSAITVERTGAETLAHAEFETETFTQAAQTKTLVDTSIVDTAASDDNTVPVDSTAPQAVNVALVNDSNVAGDLVTNDGRLLVTGIEADATVEYSVDGGLTWSPEFTAVEGENVVTVRQTDSAGNVSDNSNITFEVDTTPPVAASVNNSHGNDLTPIITGSATVESGDSLTVIINGATYNDVVVDENGHWSIDTGSTVPDSGTLAPFEDGVKYDVNTQVTDKAGNRTDAVAEDVISIDITAPDAPVVSLLNDSGSDNSDLITTDGRLSVTAPEAGATIEYSIDGETWTDEFIAVEGDNTVYVRQTDTEGNTSSNTKFEFKLDNQIDTPIVSLVTDSGVNGDLITNNGSLKLDNIEDGSVVEYSVNGGDWTTTYTPVEGDNSIVVRQTDTAGNSTESTPVTFILDTTAPDALTVSLTNDSGVSGSDTITNDGALTVSAAEDDAVVEYSVNGGDWTTSYTPVEGDNSIVVRQTDMAGNSTESAPVTFTLDTTAPDALTVSLTNDSGVSGSDTITNDGALTVSAAEDDAVVEYSVNGGDWTTTYTPVEGDNSVVVRQTDTAGNSTESAPVTFTLDTGIVTPTADINAGSDSAINNDDITSDNTPTIDGTGEIGASVVITNAANVVVGTGTVDADGNYSITTSTLVDGTQALTITTTDTAGNAAFVEQTITVDTGIVTPTADINAGSDSAINNDDITSDNTPTIDGTGEIGASVVITNAANVVVGTGTVEADGNYSITTSTLVDGTQALTITTTDTAGNAAFVEQTITVDTGIVTPTADINAGSDSAINNDDITSDNTPTIDGTGEIGASVVITNAANVVVGTGTVDADGNYSITTSTLVDGTQALTITTTDTAGNAAFVEQTITVDTGIVTPTADINAGSDSAINNDDITSDNTPTIDGTGEIGASVVITNAANVVVGTGTVDADGNYSITTSTLVDGTQALTITTTDTAGNAAFVEQTITVDTGIVTPTADINAGSDSAINNDDITSDNTPTIDGTGEIGASVVITNAANVVVGTGTVDADGNYSITTSTLVDGTQALTITTTDTAGNAAFVEQTITVDTAVVTPSVTIADIDANDDGVYNAAELGTDGTVTATIAVTGSKAGDTLTYNVDGATPV
ncbi:iron-regulated protein FrpC, partial [Moritella sp. PE36]|uniref:Ig-like domain-containing protein n=1 Tax=Moritella sp. PE36 TaxID=58051 RepID=UPI0001569755